MRPPSGCYVRLLFGTTNRMRQDKRLMNLPEICLPGCCVELWLVWSHKTYIYEMKGHNNKKLKKKDIKKRKKKEEKNNGPVGRAVSPIIILLIFAHRLWYLPSIPTPIQSIGKMTTICTSFYLVWNRGLNPLAKRGASRNEEDERLRSPRHMCFTKLIQLNYHMMWLVNTKKCIYERNEIGMVSFATIRRAGAKHKTTISATTAVTPEI